jgi:hypothetical protein
MKCCDNAVQYGLTIAAAESKVHPCPKSTQSQDNDCCQERQQQLGSWGVRAAVPWALLVHTCHVGVCFVLMHCC